MAGTETPPAERELTAEEHQQTDQRHAAFFLQFAETAAPHLQWLTRAIFIGTGERHPHDVIVRVWKVE